MVHIHPEELFDKLVDGMLTSPERARLQWHLCRCSACSFEYLVRLDFQRQLTTKSPAWELEKDTHARSTGYPCVPA